MRKLSMDELGRPGLEEYKGIPKIPLVIILDDIRSQQNTGSVFRTSDAFLVEKIILCGITATPPHREIHRSALGATESVRWEYIRSVTEAIRNLKSAGYRILGVEQTDQPIMLGEYLPVKGEKIAVIFGNEVHGISNEAMELVDGCLELPQYGTKHSLNVSVCAGIVIWELFRKMHFTDT